jgi:HSP20 family molecular chaperone IbpA
MTDSGKDFPFGFDWSKLETLFSELQPAKGQKGKPQNLDWIDEFVKDIIKQAIPETVQTSKTPQSSKTPLQTEVFETHRNVIARIRIPDNIEPRKLQVFVSLYHLKIEGPEGKKHTIELPATVDSRACKAVFRDGVLQVQMRKQARGERFDEVYIQFP